jgi:hypothetical protein
MQEACFELASFADSMDAHFAIETGPETAVVLRAFLDELHPDAFEILYEAAAEVTTDSFINLPNETKNYMADKWTALGATITEESSNSTVYIICLVLIIIILTIYAVNKIKKYRREKEDYE